MDLSGLLDESVADHGFQPGSPGVWVVGAAGMARPILDGRQLAGDLLAATLHPCAKPGFLAALRIDCPDRFYLVNHLYG
jgi:hypothetical protein